MPYILALDQGTTGSTALMVASDGTILSRGYREIPQSYPQPGWVEHDPITLFETLVEAGRDAIFASGVKPDLIGITNQRETLVAWDGQTGEPVHPAIVWQDRRTADRCRELRDQGLEADLRRRTGLLLDPYFTATKLEWLLANPDIRQMAESGALRVGTVESWIVAKLSGGTHITDSTNASRTMLVDLATMEWDPYLLDLFGVPRQILPRIIPAAGVIAAAETQWFGREIPITGLAGDQQAALYGQGCVAPGAAKVTYGTGAFLLRFSGTDAPPVPADGILATAAASADGSLAWALEGSVFIAGAAVQWLRDGLGLIADAAETAELARSVGDSGGVSFVPAFTGLGAPHWNAAARGTIVGLTRGTTTAHLVRATLEAVAHSTTDLVEVMGGVEELRVDGGATANDWLMQLQADLLGVPVVRPALLDLTAYGAARLAAIGAGWPPLPPAGEAEGGSTRFEPAMSTNQRAAMRADWQRAVAASLAWADHGRSDGRNSGL